MGFLGRINIALAADRREMGTRDFIWLAALGTAARGPATLEDVCHAIDVITHGQWLPIGDLVAASVDEMVRGGHLQAAAGARLRLTQRGRQTLSLLLGQPIARPSSVFGQVGLRLKLAFLDLAEEGERRLHFDSLIAIHEEELARSQSPEEQNAARGSFGDLWRSHDIDRVRRDVALLRRMAGMAAGAPATRH
ncbi:MAG: hypothetical protein ACM3Q1_13720 [Bacteroidales bacterium]